MTKPYLDFDKIRTKAYHYNLPEERIAKHPTARRDASKLLLYEQGRLSRKVFRELPEFLSKEDLLVFNETKVIKARLFFRKPTGARIEIFCLEPHTPSDYELAFQSGSGCVWKCAVGNLKKWKTGELVSEMEIRGRLRQIKAKKLSPNAAEVLVQFSWDDDEITFGNIPEAAGKIPIPPYLKRDSEASDHQNYQTVYSRVKGSVAAPTAGLHFTPEVMQALDAKGISKAFVNLHVGAGTFRPVSSQTAAEHEMHSERFSVKTSTLKQLIDMAGTVTAVGTTSVRTLESLYWFGVKQISQDGDMHFLSQNEINSLPKNIPVKEALEALLNYTEQSGEKAFNAATQIFIVPGYDFRVVGKIITNFHLPKSTLLMLVSAFVGEDWKKIYEFALRNDFRFLSYGDSSLLIPKTN